MIFPGKRARVGLVLDSDRVQAIQVSGCDSQTQVDWLKSANLTEFLFSGEPNETSKAALFDFFSKISKNKDKAAGLSIALPDPALSVRMLEFDEIPGSSNELSRLVKWRLSKELNIDQELIHCTYQLLGRTNGKQQLMAMMLNKNWYDCLLEAAEKTGMVILSLTMSSTYQFNYWHKRCAGKGEPSGLVVVTDYYWTLYIWDESGNTRLVRSRWLGNGANRNIETIASDIALQIEQTIMAFSMSSYDHKMSHLYIAGEPYQVDSLAEVINSRIDTDSISLKLDSVSLFHKNEKIKIDEIPSSTLATVLQS